MYPFPPADKLQSFRGDVIAQVWLDPYGVRLVFESMKELYAELGIEQLEPNGTVWTFDCKATDGSPIVLHRLLYKCIVMVEREEFRFTFRFEDGSALSILSELGPYESGHINTPDGDFVIF